MILERLKHIFTALETWLRCRVRPFAECCGWRVSVSVCVGGHARVRYTGVGCSPFLLQLDHDLPDPTGREQKRSASLANASWATEYSSTSVACNERFAFPLSWHVSCHSGRRHKTRCSSTRGSWVGTTWVELRPETQNGSLAGPQRPVRIHFKTRTRLARPRGVPKT